jgi:hypothetical protein
VQSPEFAHESVAVVVLGTFNPTVISPVWLLANGLVGEKQAKSAVIRMITAELASFDIEWLTLEVTCDRLLATTADPTEYPRLRDLALGIFAVLDETPVMAVGINRVVHMRQGSADAWHRVGDTVAPKEFWNGFLTLPGTAGLSVRGVRQDEYLGFVNIRFEPSSVVVPNGIFVERNDHYVLRMAERQPKSRAEADDPDYARRLNDIKPSSENVALLTSILAEKWDESIVAGNEVAQSLWELGEK